jgi:hypothetical protein
MVVDEDNVVKFKNIKNSKLSHIKVTDTTEAPVFETTPAENDIIKKFLAFVLKDLEYQKVIISNSGMSKNKLVENLIASSLIIEYVNILVKEIDRAEI